MYNTMNGVNVSEKLGLGPEVRELKFGSSFTSSGRGQQAGSFHSVRYDFTPASVDTSKMATLDVGPNGQVTISMPNVDGNGTTVFKGARKPYAKECVLIIDQDTGEVVLEKLTHNIQVKRTREEGGSKKSNTLSMPVAPAPAPPPETKKAQPPPPSSFKADTKMANRDRDESKKVLPPKGLPQMQHQPNSSKRGPSNSPMLPHQLQQRQSPNNKPSPGHVTSPPMSFSPSAGLSQETHRPIKQQQQQPTNILSLTDFEDLLSMPQMNTPPNSSKPNLEKPAVKDNSSLSASLSKTSGAGAIGGGNPKNVSALSESSSGDDSSSSSSSEDDDDDSSDMEEVPDKVPIPPVPESSKSPALGNNSSRARPQPVAVAPSMPTDLLCEDLQLSESGSDSE